MDASQDTQLVLNSNWHSTSSQIICNWHSRETCKVCQTFPAYHILLHCVCMWPAGWRGVAAGMEGKTASRQDKIHCTKDVWSLELRTQFMSCCNMWYLQLPLFVIRRCFAINTAANCYFHNMCMSPDTFVLKFIFFMHLCGLLVTWSWFRSPGDCGG